MRGKLIVFEGVEGCGKTTQLQVMQAWLTGSGLAEQQETEKLNSLVAQNFLSYKQKSNLSNSFTTYEAIMDKANNGQCVMHVFKGDNSYIVVAADDRVYPILAYYAIVRTKRN